MVQALKLRIIARTETAAFSELLPIAIFCGIGLFLSLSVLILDQYVPGDWF